MSNGSPRSIRSNTIRVMVDAICVVTMLFAAQQWDVLWHGIAKFATGSFGYVSLYTQTFGLSEVVVHQVAPISPQLRIAAHALPTVSYLAILVVGLLAYPKLPSWFRFWVAWLIAASAIYAAHYVILGTLYQGGPLGAVEDQLGHPGVSIFLLLLLSAIAFLWFRTRGHRESSTDAAALLLLTVPLAILVNYRMLHLTHLAATSYKTVVILVAGLLTWKYGAALRHELIPNSKWLRSALVVAAVVFISFGPNSNRFLKSRYRSIQSQPPSSAFASIPAGIDYSGLLFVAEENRDRLLAVRRDGAIWTVATHLQGPETLFFDTHRRRLIVGGANEVRTYTIDSNLSATTIVADWKQGAIECLIADEQGMIVGYLPDQVARIDEAGNLRPLLTLESPDSLVMLANDTLLIGTTRSDENSESTDSLHLFELKNSHAEVLKVNQRLDNIEALVPLQEGQLLLGLGSMRQRGTPQLCRLDINTRDVHKIVAVTDVEGLCRWRDGQITFSNDELSTVFKISNRGGIYPFAHLFDPDDLATTAIPE